jgi:nucleolar protein 9
MGKKRKLEEAPQDDGAGFEEDVQPSTYTQNSSGSRVEAETVSYLSEVAEHFATIGDPEEKQLLLSNVLEEIQGKELRIACDAVTSRLLEQLLVGAPASQLMQFLQAFTNEDMMFSLAGGCAESSAAAVHLSTSHTAYHVLVPVS